MLPAAGIELEMTGDDAGVTVGQPHLAKQDLNSLVSAAAERAGSSDSRRSWAWSPGCVAAVPGLGARGPACRSQSPGLWIGLDGGRHVGPVSRVWGPCIYLEPGGRCRAWERPGCEAAVPGLTLSWALNARPGAPALPPLYVRAGVLCLALAAYTHPCEGRSPGHVFAWSPGYWSWFITVSCTEIQ